MKNFKRLALAMIILIGAIVVFTHRTSAQFPLPNKPPLLVYPNPQSMLIGGTLSVKPKLGPTDNTSIASIAASSVTPATFTGNVTVDASGKVTISNPGTVGTFLVAIRVIDSQGAITIARFRLRVRTVECDLYNQAPTSPTTGVIANKRGPGVGDFTNDGNVDLIILEEQAHGISILLGDGAGNFAAPPNSFTGGLPISYQAAPADFDRDGHLDLALRTYHGFAILLGDGTGSFNMTTDISFPLGSTQDLTVSDFNNDGRPDVAFTESEAERRIHVYLNSSLLGFIPAPGSPKTLINSPSNIESRDFNNDGNVDIAVQVSGSSVFTYLGDGTGGFAGNLQLQFPLLPGTFSSMVAEDFNQDGNDDIAITSQGQTLQDGILEVHLGTGTGAFTPGATTATSGYENIGMISTDFNLDGNRDLLSGRVYATSLSKFQNDGNGVFQNLLAGNGPFSPHGGVRPAAEDFNNDGEADVVSVNFGGEIDVVLHAPCAPIFNPAAIEISRCDPPVLKTLGTIISDDFPVDQSLLDKESIIPGVTVTNLTTSGNQVVGLVDAADYTPLGTHQFFVRVMRPDINYLWDVGYITLSVVDCTAPPPLVLVQPPDISVSSTPDTCGAVVNYNTPQATGGSPPVTVSCAPASGSLFSTGSTTVTCTATDEAGNQASKSFNVNVTDNQAPQFSSLPDIVVNAAAGECSAMVNFNIAATDNCAGVTVMTNPSSGSVFPEGTTQVTATATDAAGNVTTLPFNVTVIGSGSAPTITTPVATPAVLWPPNHKMKNVDIDYAVTPGCGGPATCTLSVTSNEPINGTGDGDIAPDWEIVNPHRVRLRAERSGDGTGRIYTITITCTDAAGNQSTKTVTVTVPY